MSDDSDGDLSVPCLRANLRGRPAVVAVRLREPSQFGAGTRSGARAISLPARPRYGATPRRCRCAGRRASRSARAGPRSSGATGKGRKFASSSKSQMPTGSFKDRGTAVMINHLLEVGVGAIHEDSSGNAGASIATYAAASGIPCRIYVPAAAPRGKLVQIAVSGADVRAIPGTRQAVTEAALAAAGESFYASHNWQPHFIEGTKTLAFELWEQLGFRPPDNILVPTGYGSNILGLDRGFDELERSGEITARPRLFAVQAANCAAFAAAWAAGGDRFVPFSDGPYCCRRHRLPKPVRVAEVVRALRRSKGGVVAVPEEEIAPALAALGRLGLFVEPTAATAGAALTRLLRDGTIGPDQTTVVVLTGSGLKAADRVGELLGLADARPGFP